MPSSSERRGTRGVPVSAAAPDTGGRPFFTGWPYDPSARLVWSARCVPGSLVHRAVVRATLVMSGSCSSELRRAVKLRRKLALHNPSSANTNTFEMSVFFESMTPGKVAAPGRTRTQNGCHGWAGRDFRARHRVRADRADATVRTGRRRVRTLAATRSAKDRHDEEFARVRDHRSEPRGNRHRRCEAVSVLDS